MVKESSHKPKRLSCNPALHGLNHSQPNPPHSVVVGKFGGGKIKYVRLLEVFITIKVRYKHINEDLEGGWMNIKYSMDPRRIQNHLSSYFNYC